MRSTIENTYQPAPSRGQRILQVVLWSLAGIFFLLTFTLIKIPTERIRNWLDGNIALVMAQRGISYYATKKELSFFPSVTYHLDDLTLNFPPPSRPAHFEQLTVSPSIFPLVFGRYGGKAEIKTQKQSFSVDGSLSDISKGLQGSFGFASKKFDFGKTGLFATLAGVQVSSAIVDGKGNLKGDFMSPVSLEGNIALDLNSLTFEPQSIQGFAVPKLSISESRLDLGMEKGKLIIKTLKLGKTGSTTDDIRGTIQGEIALQKDWFNSMVNLKINFSLSENVQKAFSLVEMLLAAYKQPDGSFSLLLTGPLFSPTPSPIK